MLKILKVGAYEPIGTTVDDAAGEAFDKVAKLLGLPYPGGPHLERLAATSDGGSYHFARPMVRRNQTPDETDYYDVSFSGLKTAVLNATKAASNLDADRAAIAHAFQDSLIDTLVEKTVRAAKQFGRSRVVLGGGVACNRTLAAAMRARFEDRGVRVYAPAPRFATDNAAMIARAGLFHLERGERSMLDLNAFASQPLPGLVAA